MFLQLFAIALLIERLMAFYFMVLVVRRQYTLSRKSIDTGLVAFRRVMTTLAVVFLVGNLVPITFDFYYAFIDVPREASPLIMAYTFSNATLSMIAAILLWNVYRIASHGTQELVDEE